MEQEGEEVLVIALELRGGTFSSSQLQEQAHQIRQHVASEIGVSIYELVVLRPKTIIKTTSGKISRHAVRQAYKQNALSVIFRDRCKEIDGAGKRGLYPSFFVDHLVEQEIPSPPTPLSSSILITASEINQANQNTVGQEDLSLSREIENGSHIGEVEITLPSVVDGINTLVLHGEELEDVLLEDVCYLCGIQSYMVNMGDTLEMMGLDSLRRAQLKGILEQMYGADVGNELLFNVNTTFQELVQAVDVGNA